MSQNALNKLAGSEIVNHLNWRYAVKKFDPSLKISNDDWNVLQESLRLAASSYGLQPWKFLIIENPEVRKKLTPVSWGQQQIENASHLIVLTHLKTMNEDYVQKYIQTVSSERSVPMDQLKGYFDMMVGNIVKGKAGEVLTNWTARQTYIAMGTFLTTASLLNIDACPIEGIDAKKYDEILGLTDSDYQTVAVIAAGYRSKDDQYQFAKKVRFKKEEVFKKI